MAVDFRALALEKAEIVSSHMKQLLSSGQGYIRAQIGVDLGLNPELYPTWVILSTAVVALLLLLVVSWAALCNGKKRGSSVPRAGFEPIKASFDTTTKPEEPKKKNRKKSTEKKAQSNGRTLSLPQEKVKVSATVPGQFQETVTEKVQVEQAPVLVKKTKKKVKVEVKPTQSVSTSDGKEPDDGAWETKVSNREKKQQRRKDKGPEDSGSPGGTKVPKSPSVAPVTPATTNNRKNRESLHSKPSGKGNASSVPAPSGRKDEPSVNSGRCTDVSFRASSTLDRDKRSSLPAGPQQRGKQEPPPWRQEKKASWSGLEGRVKADLNPVSFTMLGLKPTEPISHPIDLQWNSHFEVDEEWSSANGVVATDSSSDWNAPSEHWGNYEEPPVLVTPVPPPKEQPGCHKVPEDARESEDPTEGAAKSKKKKKKKKSTEEEEPSSVSQTVTSLPPVNKMAKPAELPPAVPSNKQALKTTASHKKTDQIVEPQIPALKKKVRRET